MAESLPSNLCGPCNFDNTRKEAKKWCVDCEEGICADCEKAHRCAKLSRDHKLIAIADYTKFRHAEITTDCLDHGKKFDFFCKTHDVVLCVSCLPSRHNNCSDVVPIGEVAGVCKKIICLRRLGGDIGYKYKQHRQDYHRPTRDRSESRRQEASSTTENQRNSDTHE